MISFSEWMHHFEVNLAKTPEERKRRNASYIDGEQKAWRKINNPDDPEVEREDAYDAVGGGAKKYGQAVRQDYTDKKMKKKMKKK